MGLSSRRWGRELIRLCFTETGMNNVLFHADNTLGSDKAVFAGKQAMGQNNAPKDINIGISHHFGDRAKITVRSPHGHPALNQHITAGFHISRIPSHASGQTQS